MSLTRKHFIFFAEWLAKWDNLTWEQEEELIQYFEDNNEKFDRDMFFAHIERLRNRRD